MHTLLLCCPTAAGVNKALSTVQIITANSDSDGSDYSLDPRKTEPAGVLKRERCLIRRDTLNPIGIQAASPAASLFSTQSFNP